MEDTAVMESPLLSAAAEVKRIPTVSMVAYTGGAARIMGCGAITASASRFRSRRAESGARARRDRVRRWTCRG